MKINKLAVESSRAFYFAKDLKNMVDKHNNHMHSDSKKRCSFLTLLFAAGDVKRGASLDAPRSLVTA